MRISAGQLLPQPAWRSHLVIIGIACGIGLIAPTLIPLVFLICALAIVGTAVNFTEKLSVATFWALPYMAANLPTGAFTLKLPEAVAYLFTAAVIFKAIMRRERVAAPPATPQVLLYLTALCLSTIFAPPVPIPYLGTILPSNRNSPGLRPISIIIWLLISWAVVVALYHIVNERPQLLRKWLRAHILSSGLACLISIAMYFMAMAGASFVNIGGLQARSLVVSSGVSGGLAVLRLAGVAYEPLFLAFYLLTVMPLTLLAAIYSPTWMPRKLAAPILGVQSLTMLMTMSSGGWAGLFATLIVILPLIRRHRLDRRGKIGFALAILVSTSLLTTLLVTNESYLGGASAAVTKIINGGDQFRDREWAVGRRLFQEYPVFGCGPGLASFFFPRYHELFQAQELESENEVNNVPLCVLAESGLIGFGALCWCVIAGLRALFSAILRSRYAAVPTLMALTASLIGCGVQYMSMNPLFLIYFSALLGLSLATMRATQRTDFIDPLLLKTFKKDPVL